MKDLYKSQNCSQFYKDKCCNYGKRCTFRHEFRSFKKLHRHYYISHLAALTGTHIDLLDQAKNAPDGSELQHEELLTPTTSETSDSESDVPESDTSKDRLNASQLDDTYRVSGARRLSCFVLYTQSEG